MPTEITDIHFWPLRGEFEVTVVETDDEGQELGKLVATAKTLNRLIEIIAPASPTNL